MANDPNPASAPAGGPESPAPPVKRGRGRPPKYTPAEKAQRLADKEAKRKNRFAPRNKARNPGRPLAAREKQEMAIEAAAGIPFPEIAERHMLRPHRVRDIVRREIEHYGGKEEFEKVQKETLSVIAMRQVESLLNLQAQVDDAEFANLSYMDKLRALDQKSRFLRNIKGNEPANINVDNRQQLMVNVPQRATRDGWDTEVKRAALAAGGAA